MRRIALAVILNVPVYVGGERLQRQVRPFASNRPAQYPFALALRDREGEVVLQFIKPAWRLDCHIIAI
jgi:hypothetical protein